MDHGCGQQPGFITQPTELDDVSDHSCELTHSVEAYSLDNIVLQNKKTNIVSSLDFIDEVSSHQKPSDDITGSDVDKSSVANGYLVCCVNQSCDGHIDNDEYWYPRVVQGSPESVKTVEESSPIDEFNTEMGSPLVVMQSDLCGSTERTCTSLEEVVQMQAEGQFDSLVCHGVRPKDIFLHMDIEQAATAHNFAFDKTLDLVRTANFITQDGRLESIVYDALNNHAQRKNSENKTFVGVPDTAVILRPQVDGFTDNCPHAANASHDGQILFCFRGTNQYTECLMCLFFACFVYVLADWLN